jgi:hypothetical protein
MIVQTPLSPSLSPTVGIASRKRQKKNSGLGPTIFISVSIPRSLALKNQQQQRQDLENIAHSPTPTELYSSSIAQLIEIIPLY